MKDKAATELVTIAIENKAKISQRSVQEYLKGSQSITPIAIGEYKDLDINILGYALQHTTYYGFDKEYITQQDALQTPHSITERYVIPHNYTLSVEDEGLTRDSLHLIETALFVQALGDLQSKESAADFCGEYGEHKAQESECVQYPNNVVLVDIFARDKDGKIQIKDGKPETHTVALWKKRDGEIVLIDPSNMKFSAHLVPRLRDLAQKNNGSNIVPIEIPAVRKKSDDHKLFEATDNEDRDCIKIAATIGMELNAQQIKCKANGGKNFDQLEDEMLVKISNQPNTLAAQMHFSKQKICADKIKRLLQTQITQDQQNIRSSAEMKRQLGFNTLKGHEKFGTYSEQYAKMLELQEQVTKYETELGITKNKKPVVEFKKTIAKRRNSDSDSDIDYRK